MTFLYANNLWHSYSLIIRIFGNLNNGGMSGFLVDIKILFSIYNSCRCFHFILFYFIFFRVWFCWQFGCYAIDATTRFFWLIWRVNFENFLTSIHIELSILNNRSALVKTGNFTYHCLLLIWIFYMLIPKLRWTIRSKHMLWPLRFLQTWSLTRLFR